MERSGKWPYQSFKRSILPSLSKQQRTDGMGLARTDSENEGAVIREDDCAFCVTTPRFLLGDPAELYGTLLRGLYALEGEAAGQVSVSLLLHTEDEEETIRESWIKPLGKYCRDFGLLFSGADVVRKEGRTSGHLVLAGRRRLFAPQKIQAGDSIVMCGFAGLSGTRLLLKRKEKVQKDFPEGFFDTVQKEPVPSPEGFYSGFGVKLSLAIGEGGAYEALWRLSAKTGLGLSVNMRSIPLFQETVELCERTGLNPYALVSDGATLLVTSEPESLMQAGKGVVIGSLTASRDKHLFFADECQDLARPAEDEIFHLA